MPSAATITFYIRPADDATVVPVGSHNVKQAQPQVVVAGHICLDIIPAFPATGRASLHEVLAPGKLVNVGPAVVSTGGAVSNTGLALRKLGVATALMGKVGDDLLGGAILKLLGQSGAAEGMAVVPGESTSYTLVIAPPGIDRMFLHHPGANDTFSAADVRYELVRQSKLFHLGYPPLMKRLYENDGEQVTEIFRRVKQDGITTSLDVSLPDPATPSGRVNWDLLLRRTLPHVDIFLPSIEETLFMLDRERYLAIKTRAAGREQVDFFEPEDLCRLGRRLLDYGAGIAVIKCGRRGWYVATAGQERLASFGTACPHDAAAWAKRELWGKERFYVEPIASATGAGDSSIAGFLCAYLHAHSIEMCLRYACAVGGQNVRVFDAVSGIKTWDETQQMVAAGWEKNRLDLPGEHWRYEPRLGLWLGKSDRQF